MTQISPNCSIERHGDGAMLIYPFGTSNSWLTEAECIALREALQCPECHGKGIIETPETIRTYANDTADASDLGQNARIVRPCVRCRDLAKNGAKP